LLEFFVSVRELDTANPFVGGSDKHTTKWRVGAGVANGRGNGSTAILRGFHAQLGGGTRIEATGRAIARFVHGAGDRVPRLELLAKSPHAAGIRVFLRGDPEHGLERSLQMERALAKFGAEVGERERLVEVL